MSEQHLGFLPPKAETAHAVLEAIGADDTAKVVTQPVIDATDTNNEAAVDRAQLNRDIAAIEKASATLRRADPAMETWTDAPPVVMQKPRPVWLLIGVLWLSTALITIGAMYAISTLVG
ncbi:MAG TPA: hypothetical protein VMV19_02445 [Xanthobacteraceae bacterium]|nr:hypothetical protein [Xanthobacteraceae bacterium]